MPAKDIQFPLVWPLMGYGRQTSTHRIISHVIPFCGIAFVAAQLGVPKISLPECAFGGSDGLTDRSFPVANPVGERFDRQAAGCTKKMQVIRHDDVASDEPMIRLGPGFAQGLMNPAVREQLPPILCANGEKDDDGLVGSLNQGQVHRTMPRR